MNWQEFVLAQRDRDRDPDWAFETWVTFKELADKDREVLQAFADELVKRMQPLIERMVDEEEQYRHVVSTNDIECTMDQLLTEAGVAQ